MDRDQLEAAARAAVKAQGCICRPDITIRQDPDDLVAHADVSHASWCPLLLARNRRNN